MEPIVDLAPGAESSILARFFAERVRENVKQPKRRLSFFSMKSTIFVVDFDSGQATTLRFDHGRLTLHEGTIGLPSVTIGGPLRALLGLDRIRLADLPGAILGRPTAVSLVDRTETRGSTPPPSQGPSSTRAQHRADLAEILRLLARGELKIYGLSAHPRTVVRFLRLIRSPSS
ncbi:MAG: hypothetical protein HOW73_17710 [Polyangiaceae bacterium]|nr:hypothetical protein [Polyangiaceae bacterium]